MFRRINLDFNLIQDGIYTGPPVDGSAKLGSLFSTTFAVEARPSFLLFRVKDVTTKPWPLSVAGLLPHFTTDESLIKGAIGVLPKCKIWGTDIRWYDYFGIVADENTDSTQMRFVEESRHFRA